MQHVELHPGHYVLLHFLLSAAFALRTSLGHVPTSELPTNSMMAIKARSAKQSVPAGHDQLVRDLLRTRAQGVQLLVQPLSSRSN